jgi:Peptidase family S58
MLAPYAMTSLFRAVAEATEEAILNALCIAETMIGKDGRTIHALPLDRVQQVMRRYRQLTKPPRAQGRRGIIPITVRKMPNEN